MDAIHIKGGYYSPVLGPDGKPQALRCHCGRLAVGIAPEGPICEAHAAPYRAAIPPGSWGEVPKGTA